MVAATAAHTRISDPAHRDAVEHDDRDAEHDLEQEQLDRDRGGLARGTPTRRRGPRAASRRAPGSPPRSRTNGRRRAATPAARSAQNKPGAARLRKVVSASSANANKHHDDARERQDLLRARRAIAARCAGPCPRPAAPIGGSVTPSPPTFGCVDPARRRPAPSRVASDAGEVELVRREQHRAALGRRGAHDLRRGPRALPRRARRAVRRGATAAAGARARSRARAGDAAPATADRARPWPDRAGRRVRARPRRRRPCARRPAPRSEGSRRP